MRGDEYVQGPNLLLGEPGADDDLVLQAHHEAQHDDQGRDGTCWCCCFRCADDPRLFDRIAAFWHAQQVDGDPK